MTAPSRDARRTALCAAFLLAAACMPARAAETLDAVGASAQRDLEASLAELGTLRETIQAEKVPLAAALRRLEDRLGALRREHEGVTRDVDSGNLERATLGTETKLRQDEVAYLGTILDEYRANFEQRLHPGELQRYQPVLEIARDAPENSNLPLTEKFDRRIALVKTSVARLEEAIGGARFAGKAVDPQGVVVDGTFALIGPVALFASAGGGLAGVAMPQTGSAVPAVRPLDEALQPGLAAVVGAGVGNLPFDPTRGGALKELVQRASLIHLFKRGGPIMWPLLFASILALGTVIERLMFLMTERKRRDEKGLQDMLDAVEAGDVPRAARLGETSKYFICRALTYALVHREKSISNALMLAQSLEIKRFSRGIAILDTVITLAPLLGLLGTVTGMMHSFSLIGGDLSSPGAITGGIAEALIATAFGLGIAITALIPFNYLNARVEEARHELDAASTRLELLLHPPREIVIPPAAVAS
jgi:biopolymer transport protein ExbB